MALRISISHPSTHQQIPAAAPEMVPRHGVIRARSSLREGSSTIGGVGIRGPTTMGMRKRSRGVGMVVTRASLEIAAEKLVGTVTEVDKDTFWPIVKGAGQKTVVLDMYTQWCGPCKIIAPKYQELSQKYDDVILLKLDCNQENKPLAKELGIRVVPTFKILKNNEVVKEVTGAKFDELVAAIEAVRAT